MAFEVTPEMMASISKDIDSKIQEWDTSVKTLYTDIESLCSMTEGRTRDALANRMNNDQPKFNALSSLMTEYSTAIVEMAKMYDEGDIAGESRIKK